MAYVEIDQEGFMDYFPERRISDIETMVKFSLDGYWSPTDIDSFIYHTEKVIGDVVFEVTLPTQQLVGIFYEAFWRYVPLRFEFDPEWDMKKPQVIEDFLDDDPVYSPLKWPDHP